MHTDFWQRTLVRKTGRRGFLVALGAAGAAGVMIACGGKDPSATTGTGDSGAAGTGARPAGWTEESHGKEATPNYQVVFPKDRVNEMAITVAAADWQAMLDDMTKLFGARGANRGTGGGAGPQAPGGPGGGQGGLPGGGGGDFTAENPIWKPATVSFSGRTWTNVGFRFKGNSSLRSSWSSGTDKIPFKLDFDEFEDDFPEIKDQRFHGFRQLSLANNTGDPSAMREAIAYDLMEAAGLVAAETGFYEIILDRGAGRTSLGLYTVIEVIDDTVVRRAFKDSSGPIYEAEGTAASFAAGTYDRIKQSFPNESDNETDWGDVQALYNALHSPDRTANPANWRKRMESVLDVDGFLKWLGLSAAIQHWDTYGAMNHNYYLYGDPVSGRLTWISWDHNGVLGASPGGGAAGAANVPAGAPPGGQFQPGANAPGGGGLGGRMTTSLDKKDVGANWPLIRFLLDDAAYYAKYISFLRTTTTPVFDPDKLADRYKTVAAMLAPKVSAVQGGAQSYSAAVESLTQVTRTRAQALKDFLATQA